MTTCPFVPALPISTTAGRSAANSNTPTETHKPSIAGARRSICIASPYLLPDRSMRAELRKAVRRGVRVRVVVPGAFNNHPLARRASRRRYGDLLGAGVEMLEYEPA